MTYILAFLIGGLICGLGQLILDNTTFTPGHMLVLFTVLGAVLGGIGLYEPLIKLAGAGALIPVSGFGSSLVRGVMVESQKLGWVGLLTGVFEFTGLGLAAAVFFGTIIALIFTPRS
ncbi:MAG TPA: SpoVA/SpoVAEb family sporulation membrane protein [Firmicutes bacterium]|nr:SpoVA/SpoVAEb family sporulation membrane protein [Bacillota bacterium]